MRATAISVRLSLALVAGAVSLPLLGAAPAYAGDYGGGGQGNGGSHGAGSLTLDLKGHVRGHCGFQTPPPKTVDLGDLTVAGTASAPFKLNCNTPFRLRINSANGFMALQNPPADVPKGFDKSDPYQLAVSFDTDLGTVASGDCVSHDLHSHGVCRCYGEGPGQGLSSGEGVSIGKDGAVHVTWSAPTAKLVAGSYADTITITVEVRS